MENKEQPTIITQTSAFGDFMKSVRENGIIKTFCTILLFAFFTFIMYIALNPNVVFDRYDKYMADKHAQSTEYRMQSAPLVRNYLNQLSSEIDADRTYILEYHNGKSNPSGLQWQYCDMTFLNDNTCDIRDEFQNISLVKYPIFYEVSQNGIWIGSVDIMEKIDKRFALRMKMDDVQYVAFTMIYGMNFTEIGVLGVSYLDGEILDETSIRKALRKYAASISPLLDGTKVAKK